LTSPYYQVGAKLVDNGYAAIPILPGTKRPGQYTQKNWFGTSEWQRYCDRLPTSIETALFDAWPDAGVCVALDTRLKVIDVDTDDSELMRAVMAVLPDTPVKKRGAKGFSAFYKGSPAIVSAPFSVGKLRVVDLLCHGRQTVLPPTIHPDIGKAYVWLTDDTLLDTNIDQLPELPDNIAELLASALVPYGYESPSEFQTGSGDGETLWREVNDTALLNLDHWVPQLQLKGTKRSGQGYRAVAHWRDVDNANLSFHKEGIKDWGSNESHTPLNVVMLAFRSDLYTATTWLVKQLGMEAPDDDFDIAGFIARSKASTKPVSVPLRAPAPAAPFEPIDVKDKALRAPRGSIDPFDLRNQPGLLGEITEWIADTSRLPVPEFCTIAAAGFLGAFFGRRYLSPTNAGLNVYLVGVAGPGFGKDHPRKAIEILGHEAKMPWLIGPNEVTSDSAIEKVVRRRPCFVMPWDEVGIILQGMSGKGASSWSRSIRKSLLELYSRSTSIWTGKEKADLKADSSADPVWFPTVSMLGFSTQQEFYAGITEANFGDGFMARLTVIEAKKRPAENDPKLSLMDTPNELIKSLKLSIDAAPDLGKFNGAAVRDASSKPSMHKCTWGDGARKRWNEIVTWQRDFIDENPEYEGVVGRTGEQTIKLATIRAISRDSRRPVVSVEDIEWAYALVQRSIDMIDDGVRKYMSSSEFETLHKRVLSVITESGNDGISKSVLRRARGIGSAKNQEYDGAIKYLQETELIDSKITGLGTKGRPGAKYYATGVV
jgi:hypothetical protein